MHLITSAGYCQTITSIGSGLQESVEDNIFFGLHIAKLDSEYYIGGKFEMADSNLVNNVTIWDGENFRDAGTGVTGPVNDIFSFNENIYLFQSQILKKWNGISWESISINGRINGKHIHNDTLYLYGDELTIEGIEESSVIYFTNDTWYSLPINWEFWAQELDGFTIYNDTVFISATWDTYKLDDSSNPILSLEENGRLTNIQNKLFLTDRHGLMYEYKESKWIELIEVSSIRHDFFIMEEELYYGELNQGTFKYVNNNFELIIGRQLQITDVEKIANNEYLMVGNLRSGSDLSADIDLNDIGILKFEKPQVSLSTVPDTICENEYLYINAVDNDLTIKYDWNASGGIPDSSSWRYPVIKYPEPGQYELILTASNSIDSAEQIIKQITVINGCEVEREKRYDNVWLNGRPYAAPRTSAGLDFSNGEPNTCAFNTSFSFWGLSNSISDKEGNLMFYSDGIQLADRNHNVVLSSEGFNTGEFVEQFGNGVQGASQGLITIPATNNDSLFYLFHTPIQRVGDDQTTLPTSLLMSQVKTLSSGKVEMTQKGLSIIQDTLLNFTMQAHPHTNGEDWWIIVFEFNSDQYYKVLFKSNGTIEVEKQSLEIEIQRSRFQTSFSPNGQYFALTSWDALESYLWKFDNSNGNLTNPIVLDPNPLDSLDIPMGCAFSPSSRFLYVSSYHYLRQYDLCQDDLNENVTLVGEWDGMYTWIYPFSFARMMLAPNGKIYASAFNSSVYMSTIHSPNEHGESCNFAQHDLVAQEGNIFESNTVPEFPHYRNNNDSLNCVVSNIKNLKPINEIEVELYPNPAAQFISLKSMTNFKNQIIKIFDSNGTLVHSEIWLNSILHSIEVTELKSGLYFLDIRKNKKKIIKPFIKM
jgi:hypothetical protein